MFELLSQSFNASVIAVTQLLLSTVMTSNPWFETLEIQLLSAKNEIMCSTRLDSAFTQTLDDVLLSGQSITLHFVFELQSEGSEDPISRKEIVNGFRYDEVEEIFYVVNSEDRNLNKFFELSAAKAAYISVERLIVAQTSGLDKNQDYTLRVTAFLDPIKMKETSESVNLMLRWASVKPTIISEKFRLKENSA